jgi:hypothetical protein
LCRLLFRHVRCVPARSVSDGGGDTLVAEPQPGLDRARVDRVDPIPRGPNSLDSALLMFAGALFAAL